MASDEPAWSVVGLDGRPVEIRSYGDYRTDLEVAERLARALRESTAEPAE